MDLRDCTAPTVEQLARQGIAIRLSQGHYDGARSNTRYIRYLRMIIAGDEWRRSTVMKSLWRRICLAEEGQARSRGARAGREIDAAVHEMRRD